MTYPLVVVTQEQKKPKRRRGKTRMPPAIRLKALCMLASFAGCVEKLLTEESITRSGLAEGMQVDRTQSWRWGKRLSLPREPGSVLEILMLRGCITPGSRLREHLPKEYQGLWDNITDGLDPTDEVELLTELASADVKPRLLGEIVKRIVGKEGKN